MFIIKIAAALAIMIAIYRFMVWFNDFTYIEVRYRFFSLQSFGWYAGSYIAMYAGHHMFITHWQGDTLNGAIVIITGFLIFIIQIRSNFKRIPILIALAGSLAQSILYIPITILALAALFIAIAAASRIRPAFCINGE